MDVDINGLSTRILRHWIQTTAEKLAEKDDPRWQSLRFHDLRRTKATQLKDEDVDALLVFDWGGRWTSKRSSRTIEVPTHLRFRKGTSEGPLSSIRAKIHLKC
jgi:integrase